MFVDMLQLLNFRLSTVSDCFSHLLLSRVSVSVRTEYAIPPTTYPTQSKVNPTPTFPNQATKTNPPNI